MALFEATCYGKSGSTSSFLSHCADANYIYAVGYTSAGLGVFYGGLLMKINKSTLAIEATYAYGYMATHQLWLNCVREDGDYIYTQGYTWEGAGVQNIIVSKFAKSDLSLIAHKRVSYPATGTLHGGMVIRGDFVYLFGGSSGFFNEAGIILKLNKSDLTLVIGQEYYDPTAWPANANFSFNGGCVDATHAYAVGERREKHNGAWAWYRALIVKYNLSDLSVAAEKIYGNSPDNAWPGREVFYDVIEDGNYVYAVGWTSTQTLPNDDPSALIVKFNKSDLSVAAAKCHEDTGVIPQEQGHYFYNLFIDGDYIYLAGINDYAVGNELHIAKVNKSDLSLVIAREVSCGLDSPYCYYPFVDGDHVYFCGSSYPNGNRYGYIIKSTLDLCPDLAGYLTDKIPSMRTYAATGVDYTEATLNGRIWYDRIGYFNLQNLTLPVEDSILTLQNISYSERPTTVALYDPTPILQVQEFSRIRFVFYDERGFDWGKTIAYGLSWTEITSPPQFMSGYFDHDVEDLEDCTLYHFRPKALNEHGWGYGPDETFETPCIPPVFRKAYALAREEL